MKKFLPYFKLLLPVKGYFFIAIIAGIIYGVATGFGLPFMTAKIFPLIFSSEQKGITLYMKSAAPEDQTSEVKRMLNFSEKNDDEHLKFTDVNEFPIIQRLYYISEDIEQPTEVPPNSILNTLGTISTNGVELNFTKLYLQNEDQSLKPVEPFLYLSKGGGKYQKVDKSDFKRDNTKILLAVLMLPAVFLIRGIAGFINNYFINYCGQHVLESIRANVFAKLQSLDLAYFQKKGTGDLMTRFLVQTTRLQTVITSASNSLIREPVALVAAIGALIYLSIQNKAAIFILICLGVIPICILPVRKFAGLMLKKLKEESMGEIKIGAHLQENIAGARDIRSFNLEEREKATFHALLVSYFKQRMKMVKYKGFIAPSVEIITATGVSLAIFYSAQHGMTLETVIPLIVALYMSYEPAKKLAGLQTQLVMGQRAIEMMDEILETEEEVKDPENPKPLPELSGGIHFDRVTFRYNTGKPALKNITTQINPGEVVALVGPSGAGKSTFTHLISRTYEITKGEIFFDQCDVTEHKLSDLRAQVAVVSQSPYLFDDTIKNNIRLGKLDATDAEIILAARRANCLQFIQKLPNGFDTKCGENATLLSGGQKQRLAIARAFLKDAPILILDEATSSLDAESVQTVQTALAELVKGRTTLLIAHRFSSIKIAKRILVFDSGSIVADGSHTNLLKSSSLYKKLYLKQNI